MKGEYGWWLACLLVETIALLWREAVVVSFLGIYGRCHGRLVGVMDGGAVDGCGYGSDEHGDDR